jgi:hypothetical protein
LTEEEFAEHEQMWCSRCEKNKRGGRACPALKIMKKMPDDPAANKMFERLGRCMEFELKKKLAKLAK